MQNHSAEHYSHRFHRTEVKFGGNGGSYQSARLAIGCETFFLQIRKLCDKLVFKLVVFGVNDVNPICTSFSVSKTATFCFVSPSTDVFGQRKAKWFAVSFYNILPSLNKLSPPFKRTPLFSDLGTVI